MLSLLRELPTKDCPRKQKNKGKEKAVHTVQLLTLAKCPHYLAIEYSHEAPPHECVLTTAPWENRVSPHELFKVHGTINGRRVCVLMMDQLTTSLIIR